MQMHAGDYRDSRSSTAALALFNENNAPPGVRILMRVASVRLSRKDSGRRGPTSPQVSRLMDDNWMGKLSRASSDDMRYGLLVPIILSIALDVRKRLTYANVDRASSHGFDDSRP